MMIWKKSKEVVLDCFTVEDSVAQHFPIRETTFFKSKAIKDIPKQNIESKLTRLEHPQYCNGFQDLMKYGFIMPWWTETYIEGDLVNGEFKLKFDSHIKSHQTHLFQYGLNSEDYARYQEKTDSVVVRMTSPWKIKANDKMLFLQTNTWVYNMKNTFMPLNGLLDFWWNHNANVVVAITKQNNLRYHFNPGEPLLQYIPTEKINLKIKIHVIDDIEHFKLDAPFTFFQNRLNKLRKWSLKNEV